MVLAGAWGGGDDALSDHFTLVWYTWYVVSVSGNGLPTDPVSKEPKECTGLVDLMPRHLQ